MNLWSITWSGRVRTPSGMKELGQDQEEAEPDRRPRPTCCYLAQVSDSVSALPVEAVAVRERAGPHADPEAVIRLDVDDGVPHGGQLET